MTARGRAQANVERPECSYSTATRHAQIAGGPVLLDTAVRDDDVCDASLCVYGNVLREAAGVPPDPCREDILNGQPKTPPGLVGSLLVGSRLNKMIRVPWPFRRCF